jgi:hypothetical protein
MPKISTMPVLNKKFKIDSEYELTDGIYNNLRINGVNEFFILPDSSILTHSIAKKLKNTEAFNSKDFIQKLIDFQNCKFFRKNTPIMIVFTTGNFTNLDNIVYEKPIQEYLNRKGLDVYLWEMRVYLFNSTVTAEYTSALLTDNVNKQDFIKIWEQNKSSTCGFETTEENLNMLRCLELEKITNFVKRNNLTNVTVHAGEYGFNYYFQKKYPLLKLKTKEIAASYGIFNKNNSLHFSPISYNEKYTLPQPNTINYKFWCANRRYNGTRNIVAAYLVKRNALVSFNYSCIDVLAWSYNIPEEFTYWQNINNKLWFDLSSWKHKHTKIYNKLKPGIDYIDSEKYIKIDMDMNTVNDFWLEKIPTEYYHSCFCAVITESVFARPTGHYSEKTLNAIKCFRPFVLAAPPRTLEYLKKCGVKTFDKWWDESYDREENHENRLIKILELIDYIDSFTIDQLKDMYQEMLPILEHNYKIIQNLKNQQIDYNY